MAYCWVRYCGTITLNLRRDVSLLYTIDVIISIKIKVYYKNIFLNNSA